MAKGRRGRARLPRDLAVHEPYVPPTHDEDLANRLPAWIRRHRVTYVLTTETVQERLLREAGLRVGYLGSYNAPEGVDHLSLNTEDLGRETARLLHHALIRRDFGPPETPLIVGVRARWVPGTAGK